MVRWEAAIIALFGTLLGIAMALFFGWAVVRALHDQGFTKFSAAPISLVFIVVITALATLVWASAGYSSSRSFHHSVSEPCGSISTSTTGPAPARCAWTARWPDKVQLLRPIDYFCDENCPVVKDGLWLYAERIHLNMAGSEYLASRSENVFRQFLTAGREGK